MNSLQRKKQIIRKGSKTFSYASFFLSQKTKKGALTLYSLARKLDDITDSTIPIESKYKKLLQVKNYLMDSSLSLDDTTFQTDLDLFFHITHVPKKYFVDFLDGFFLDLHHQPCSRVNSLIEYAYHVAGIIGVMLSYPLCHTHEEDAFFLQARYRAACLGIAMQLTNIARDVYEDWTMGRLYIPQNWLPTFDIKNREEIFTIKKKLIALSHAFYVEGLEGLKAIFHKKDAFSILLAAHLYNSIGTKILKKNVSGTVERAVTTMYEKFFMLCKIVIKKNTYMYHPTKSHEFFLSTYLKHSEIDVAELFRWVEKKVIL